MDDKKENQAKPRKRNSGDSKSKTITIRIAPVEYEKIKKFSVVQKETVTRILIESALERIFALDCKK
jgi:hypothetical protein